jgi:hypothetical protein
VLTKRFDQLLGIWIDGFGYLLLCERALRRHYQRRRAAGVTAIWTAGGSKSLFNSGLPWPFKPELNWWICR